MRKPEERYGYYRRCQQFGRDGQQCKAPAMKGEALCYQHEQQAEKERRRRQQFMLPPLTDRKSVLAAIREVGQALIDDRIDEDYAGELLDQLQAATVALQGTQQ